MGYKDIQKCDCGRSWCQYADHTGDCTTSYREEDLEGLLEDAKQEIKDINDGVKNIKKLIAGLSAPVDNFIKNEK